MGIGDFFGSVGIPCKDAASGCQCGQCRKAGVVGKSTSNMTGRLFPCKDYGSGCGCTQCQVFREKGAQVDAKVG